MEITDIVSILEIATAVLLWPTATIISEYLPWQDILVVMAHAMQLSEVHLRCCEEEGLDTQPCRLPAATDQALAAVLLPAVALLTAWSVTILRSVDLHKANSKFPMAERKAMLPYLGDLILEGLIKHQQHPLSGILAILATRLVLKVGQPKADALVRAKLREAVAAGQTCPSTCAALLRWRMEFDQKLSFLCVPNHLHQFQRQFWSFHRQATLLPSGACTIQHIVDTEYWALSAGLQSESLLQLFGPDDPAASARGHGIRRLIANVMLKVFPCLEDNADCVFSPLAAWQVHNWWLPKSFTTRASVRQFQVFHSLLTLYWHSVTHAPLCLQACVCCCVARWNALLHCSCN